MTILGPLAAATERHNADWLLHLIAVLLVLLPLSLQAFAPLQVNPAPLYLLHIPSCSDNKDVMALHIPKSASFE